MYNNISAIEALWSDPCLAAKMRRAHRGLVGAYDEALRPHGLNAAQFDLLTTLMTAPAGTRAIDLARALWLDRSSLARNLARLQGRGLVAAQPGGNARESWLEVTPEGRALVESAAGAWLQVQRRSRERLGEEGVAALDLLMSRLDDHTGEEGT